MLALAWSCGGAGGGSTPPAVLTPARNLAGTWKTSIATPINFSTDSCGNAPSTMTLAGTEPWMVTWIITPGVDDNHVNIQMTFTKGVFTHVTATACSSPILVPEVSPMYLTGAISSTRMNLYYGTVPAGVFNFTTDILTGTFDYTYTGLYSQREYSDPNTMILLRK
jgi:hypothetical protein